MDALTTCDHHYSAELITPHQFKETQLYQVMLLDGDAEALFLYTCSTCGHSYTGVF